MSGTTDRSPFVLLDKPGGRPILAGAGKGPLLTGPAAGAAAGTGGTGSGTGAGGTGTGGTGTPVAAAGVPTLPTTLRVKSLAGGVPNPCVCWHGFGPGHVPAGSRPRLRDASGNEIALQTDAETYWADGSLCGAELSFVALAAAAGTVQTFTLDAVVGAPDRTPSATLSTVSSETDIGIRGSGHSWGDAFHIRVNDTIAASGNAVDNWGISNPARGIELVASGRVRMEWRVWGYARRVSDGAQHRGVVLEAYVRRWAAGAYEVAPCQWQPNIGGPHATGAVGDWQAMHAGALETYNGTGLIAACGGPNDRDARTVGAANLPSGVYRWPAGQNIGQNDWAGGVSVGLSGAVPSGLDPNGVYFPCDIDTPNSGCGLSTRRNDPGGRVASWGAVSGNVQVYPLAHSFVGSGTVGMDANGDPVWLPLPGGQFAGKARPRPLVGLDDAYITRATRFILPIDTTLPRPPEPGTPTPYRPGQVNLHEHWLNESGNDDWWKDRIGWVSRQMANLVLTPFDEVRRSHCVRLALMQADLQHNWKNERTGRTAPFNNGSDNAGASYPHLGAPIPGLFYHNNNGGTSFAAVSGYSNGGSGYTWPYNQANDGSHQGNYTQVPYMLTGHRVYRDLFRNMVFTCWTSVDPGSRQRTLDGRKYWAIFRGQDRGEGWHTHAASALRMMLPTAAPERALLEDAWREHVEFYAAVAVRNPARHLGFVTMMPWNWDGTDAHWRDTLDWGGRQFQHSYKILGWTAALYRGEERARPVVETFARFMRDQFDDTLYPNGTAYGCGRYDQYYNPAGGGTNTPGGVFATLGEMARSNAGGSGPYPERGLRDYDGKSPLWHFYDPAADPPPSEFATNYSVQQCGVLALMDWAGIAGAKRVRQQIMNRVMARPGGVTGRAKFPMASNDYPGQTAVMWSILPTGV